MAIDIIARAMAENASSGGAADVSKLKADLNQEINDRQIGDSTEVSARTAADILLQEQITALAAKGVIMGEVDHYATGAGTKLTDVDTAKMPVKAIYIVENDETKVNVTTMYTWSGTEWIYSGKFNVELKANLVTFIPTTEIISTNVQDAIEEIFAHFEDYIKNVNGKTPNTEGEIVLAAQDIKVADGSTVENAIANRVLKTDIVQTTGSAIDKIMSQKAVTDTINNIDLSIYRTSENQDVIDDEIKTTIATETQSRITADTTLQTNIETETTERTAADTTLQSNISTEITNRTTADSALQEQIAELDTKAVKLVNEQTPNEDGEVVLDGTIINVTNPTLEDDESTDLDTALSDLNEKIDNIDSSVTLQDAVDNGDTVSLNDRDMSLTEKGLEVSKDGKHTIFNESEITTTGDLDINTDGGVLRVNGSKIVDDKGILGAGNQRLVEVAKAINDTDAVNFKQLKEGITQTKDYSKGIILSCPNGTMADSADIVVGKTPRVRQILLNPYNYSSIRLLQDGVSELWDGFDDFSHMNERSENLINQFYEPFGDYCLMKTDDNPAYITYEVGAINNLNMSLLCLWDDETGKYIVPNDVIRVYASNDKTSWDEIYYDSYSEYQVENYQLFNLYSYDQQHYKYLKFSILGEQDDCSLASLFVECLVEENPYDVKMIEIKYDNFTESLDEFMNARVFFDTYIYYSDGDYGTRDIIKFTPNDGQLFVNDANQLVLLLNLDCYDDTPWKDASIELYNLDIYLDKTDEINQKLSTKPNSSNTLFVDGNVSLYVDPATPIKLYRGMEGVRKSTTEKWNRDQINFLYVDENKQPLRGGFLDWQYSTLYMTDIQLSHSLIWYYNDYLSGFDPEVAFFKPKNNTFYHTRVFYDVGGYGTNIMPGYNYLGIHNIDDLCLGWGSIYAKKIPSCKNCRNDDFYLYLSDVGTTAISSGFSNNSNPIYIAVNYPNCNYSLTVTGTNDGYIELINNQSRSLVNLIYRNCPGPNYSLSYGYVHFEDCYAPNTTVSFPDSNWIGCHTLVNSTFYDVYIYNGPFFAVNSFYKNVLYVEPNAALINTDNLKKIDGAFLYSSGRLYSYNKLVAGSTSTRLKLKNTVSASLVLVDSTQILIENYNDEHGYPKVARVKNLIDSTTIELYEDLGYTPDVDTNIGIYNIPGSIEKQHEPISTTSLSLISPDGLTETILYQGLDGNMHSEVLE